MPQVPDYSIHFGGNTAGLNPMDAFKSVVGIAQMKQGLEMMPLQKEQSQLQIDAMKREAALSPLREGILSLQKDQAAANLQLTQNELSLAPEKKAELQLMNQFRQQQIEEGKFKLQAAERDMQRQAIYQEEMTKLANNPNATASDYAKIAAVLPPQQADSIRSTFKMMNEEQQKNSVGYTAQIFSALNAGQKEIAMKLAKDRADGFRAAGNDKEAGGWDTWAKIIDSTPQFAKDHFGILLSTMPEGEKAVKSAMELNKERQLGGLPEDTRKLVNTSVTESEKLRTLANNSQDIAQRFDEFAKQPDIAWYKPGFDKIKGGSTAALGEFLKSQFGMENGITQLRKEYIAFRNSQAANVLKDLRPASDTDVAMVLKGFLSETADPSQIASYLRGMSKVSKFQAELESSKADWAQSVGTLGKSSSDMVINGVTVPAGTNFSKFSGMLSQRMYIDGIKEDYQAGRIDVNKAKDLIEQAMKRKY